MICDYCDRDLRLDSRSRCRNCGAASLRPRESALSALTGSPLAQFQDFLASTQQNVWPRGQRQYDPAQDGQVYARSLQRQGIIYPALGGILGGIL